MCIIGLQHLKILILVSTASYSLGLLSLASLRVFCDIALIFFFISTTREFPDVLISSMSHGIFAFNREVIHTFIHVLIELTHSLSLSAFPLLLTNWTYNLILLAYVSVLGPILLICR